MELQQTVSLVCLCLLTTHTCPYIPAYTQHMHNTCTHHTNPPPHTHVHTHTVYLTLHVLKDSLLCVHILYQCQEAILSVDSRVGCPLSKQSLRLIKHQDGILLPSLLEDGVNVLCALSHPLTDQLSTVHNLSVGPGERGRGRGGVGQWVEGEGQGQEEEGESTHSQCRYNHAPFQAPPTLYTWTRPLP